MKIDYKKAVKILGWYLLFVWMLVGGGLLITIILNSELPLFGYLSIVMGLIFTFLYFCLKYLLKKHNIEERKTLT